MYSIPSGYRLWCQTLQLRVRLGDLDLTERSRYTSSREEEEEEEEEEEKFCGKTKESGTPTVGDVECTGGEGVCWRGMRNTDEWDLERLSKVLKWCREGEHYPIYLPQEIDGGHKRRSRKGDIRPMTARKQIFLKNK